MSELTKNDIQMLWGMIPPECKDGLSRLQLSGRMEEAREWVLREAEATLNQHPDAKRIDQFWALELAAEKWLKARGL